jgi:hypothetical protein
MPSTSTMTALAGGAQAAGGLVSAFGQTQTGAAAREAGVAQSEEKQNEAAQLQQEAQATEYSAQIQSNSDRLNANLAIGRLKANAGAAGVVSNFGSPMTLQGQIAGRGEFNAQSALFSGETRAQGLTNQANLDIFEGQQDVIAGQVKQTSANIGAASTLLNSGSSLFNKFGGGGFNAPPNALALAAAPGPNQTEPM